MKTKFTNISTLSTIEIDRKRPTNPVFPTLLTRYSRSAALLLALNYFPIQAEAGTTARATVPSTAGNSGWPHVDVNAFTSGSRDSSTADGHSDGFVHPSKSGNGTTRGRTGIDANAFTSGSRDSSTADGHSDGFVHPSKSGNGTNRGWLRVDASAFTSGSRDSSTADGHSNGFAHISKISRTPGSYLRNEKSPLRL